jgi:hypothetical protein
MADKPKLKVVSSQGGPDAATLKEFNKRLTRAETDFQRHQARITDCYKFALPWRHKINQTQPTDQLDEIFDETIQNVLEDFAADMQNTFTPRKNDWLEFAPSIGLDVADAAMVKDQLAKYQTTMFNEMGRSNLYQALQEAYLDLGVGTMCLLITDIDPVKPIHCEAIPLTDARPTRGPFGYVDGVFRPKKMFMYEEIKSVWPDADLTKLGPVPQDTTKEVEIADGCWRDWSDRGSETYHYVVRGDGKVLYKKTWKGPGSCPFIAARWSRDSTTAIGVGPTYRTLPSIKTLNHVRYLDLKNYDKWVDPVTSYEDDGVINLDQGVEPGTWVPRAPGSEPPEVLESKARLDVAAFERDELRSTIRRAHYQDRPEQLGKTPPSATQWADEAAERARRMGTPATNLVEELQYGIARRFAYLLAERGTLPKVELGGQTVDIQPTSPLLRAQEQEAVVRNDKFAEMIGARFGPQIAAVIIDIFAFAEEQGKKLGVNPKLIRKQQDIEAAIKQLLPVLQATGAVPGGPANLPVGLVNGGAPVQ